MSTGLTFSCSLNKIKSFISHFIKSPLKQLLRTSCVVWAVMGFSYSSLSIFYLSSVLSLCSVDQNSSLANCGYPWVSVQCGKSSASTIHHRTFVKKMGYKTFAVAVYIPVTELCCYCLLLSLLMFALTSGEKKRILIFWNWEMLTANTVHKQFVKSSVPHCHHLRPLGVVQFVLRGLPAQFISKLVQLLLCSAQLRLQVLPRGVKFALQ